jgi:hypothetical protein
VKYLVSASVTDRHIPGLAAMEPDGPFIQGINYFIQPKVCDALRKWLA